MISASVRGTALVEFVVIRTLSNMDRRLSLTMDQRATKDTPADARPDTGKSLSHPSFVLALPDDVGSDRICEHTTVSTELRLDNEASIEPALVVIFKAVCEAAGKLRR